MDARSAAFFTGDATIEVAVTRLEATPEGVCAAERLLAADERQRADRFIHLRDRRRFIVARAWLRQLLGAQLHAPPEAIEFVYGDYGKPALARPFAGSDLRFNLAHAGDVAVCALTRGRDVGIDVEAVRAMRDAEIVAARLFSLRENRAFCALEASDKPLGFFNCWTRKEAFVKALGDGLSYPLDSFDVSLAPTEPARLLRIGDRPGKGSGWELHAFAPAPGHIGAIVVRPATRRLRGRAARSQRHLSCPC